jgi:hypothetical protein
MFKRAPKAAGKMDAPARGESPCREGGRTMKVMGVQAKAPGYAAFHCVRRDTRTEKQQCAGAAFLVDNETARREAGREESVGMGWM